MSRRLPGPRIYVAALVFGTGAFAGCAREPLVRLAPGAPQQGELRAGRSVDYALELVAGEYLHLVVEQRGIDLELTLSDPDGRSVLVADRPTGHTGPELILAVGETTGVYRLRLNAADSPCPSGGYEVRVEALRRADERDRARAAGYRLLTEADPLRRDEDPRAFALYQAAGERFAEAGDATRQAETEHRIGHLLRTGEGAAETERHYRSACELARQAGDRYWELIGRSALGTWQLNRGRSQEAGDQLEVALALARELDDRRQTALALHHLAQAAQRQGRLQESLDLATGALALWQECETRDRARTLHNLAVLYSGPFGQPRLAVDHFTAALRAFERLGDDRTTATVHNQLGQAYQSLGELPRAREHYQQALAQRQKSGDRCRLAVTRAKLALIDQEEGLAAAARVQADEALGQLGADCPRDEPTVRLHLAELDLQEGWPRQAEDGYEQTLALWEQRGDRAGAVAALTGLARARRAQGAVQTALEATARGIEIVESLRPSVDRDDLRVSFFATVQELYDLRVDLLMATGDAVYAFETAEQARARALRDRLQEVGVQLRRHAEPELLVEERRLLEALNAHDWQRLRQLEQGRRDSELERTIAELEARLADVHGEIRQRSPRYASLALPQPVELTEIQELLDEDTLLLEIRLGEERSFLWAVTRDDLAAFTLPPRREIEAAARATSEALRTPRPYRGRSDWRPQPFCHLSRLIFGPVADRLDRPRLLLVLDGALETLPTAALAHPGTPCDEAAPLVASHEIVYLPSAMTLATLRRQVPEPPAAGWVAVVADPVYGPEDPRLAPASVRGDPGLRWQRLRGTREEAEALLAMVPAGKGFAALGLEANKETVTGGALRDFRVVHFAVHGSLNPDQPARSFLALSLLGPRGEPRPDGLLYAHEIYDLELQAELAVLSACESGLGPRVPGEGLVSGLARGFLYAGAERVVVSLWDVHDGATSELMERFYRSLLAGGESPSKALQSAQRTLWREGRHPYYWAGFVLQGDWQPMPPFAR